jgi:hypothetical protein
MSLERYEAALKETEQKIADYNTTLANISQMKNEVLLNPSMNFCVAAPPPRKNSYRQSATPKMKRDTGAAEKTLAEFSERMLSAGQFGKSSDEYKSISGARRVKRATKISTPTPKDGTETA